MTTFFFVRHALTAHTGEKLSGWSPGISLNDEGKAQAEAIADALAGVPLNAVYSSPIDRALQTARAIAARHRLKVSTNRGLGEVDYGRWTNRSYRTLARTKLWATVQRWPSGARFPDGESLRDVQARALAAVERIRSEHPKGPVCCVSHGDPIRLIAAHYLGVHIDLFQRIAISPASISVIAIGDLGPHVIQLNASPASAAVQR